MSTGLGPAASELLVWLDEHAEVLPSGDRVVPWGTVQIAERLNRSASTVTHHLCQLREAGFVSRRRGRGCVRLADRGGVAQEVSSGVDDDAMSVAADSDAASVIARLVELSVEFPDHAEALTVAIGIVANRSRPSREVVASQSRIPRGLSRPGSSVDRQIANSSLLSDTESGCRESREGAGSRQARDAGDQLIDAGELEDILEPLRELCRRAHLPAGLDANGRRVLSSVPVHQLRHAVHQVRLTTTAGGVKKPFGLLVHKVVEADPDFLGPDVAAPAESSGRGSVEVDDPLAVLTPDERAALRASTRQRWGSVAS